MITRHYTKQKSGTYRNYVSFGNYKSHLYLTTTSEPLCVYCEYFGEYWPCYNGNALHWYLIYPSIAETGMLREKFVSIVKCLYNAVQIITILLRHCDNSGRNLNRILESQQTPHTLPSRASYGVSIVRIWDKIDSVITAPHCIWLIPWSIRSPGHHQTRYWLCRIRADFRFATSQWEMSFLSLAGRKPRISPEDKRVFVFQEEGFQLTQIHFFVCQNDSTIRITTSGPFY